MIVGSRDEQRESWKGSHLLRRLLIVTYKLALFHISPDLRSRLRAGVLMLLWLLLRRGTDAGKDEESVLETLVNGVFLGGSGRGSFWKGRVLELGVLEDVVFGTGGGLNTSLDAVEESADVRRGIPVRCEQIGNSEQEGEVEADREHLEHGDKILHVDAKRHNDKVSGEVGYD